MTAYIFTLDANISEHNMKKDLMSLFQNLILAILAFLCVHTLFQNIFESSDILYEFIEDIAENDDTLEEEIDDPPVLLDRKKYVHIIYFFPHCQEEQERRLHSRLQVPFPTSKIYLFGSDTSPPLL